MTSNSYKKPFLHYNNIIITNENKYALKDIDLLLNFMSKTSLFDNEFSNNKQDNIYEFKEKYQNIEPLSIYLKQIDRNKLINIMQDLVKDISKQIKFLESEGKTIVSININDIIVINKNIFLFINEFKICKQCAETNYAIAYMPIPTSDYISPEILKSNFILPLKFHITSCYWSLAALALDLLFNYKVDINYNLSKILLMTKPISFYPLRNFILRGIIKEADNRTLICI